MKKHLVFAFAMMLSVAGFAQNVGDYVYTAKGKYKITAEQTSNILTSDMIGWSAVTASETGASVAEQFAYTDAGISALANAAAEGITYPLTGIDGNSTYIVTLTIAQPEPAETMHRGIQPQPCSHITTNVNCLSISGKNIDDEGDVAEYADPTEIFLGEARNYYFAITPDESGAARNYAITLRGWASDLFISNIKIMEAQPVGDERKIAALLEHAKTIQNLRSWTASEELDALVENIELAESLVAEPDTEVDEMLGAIEGLNEVVNDFEAKQMDAYLTNVRDRLDYADGSASKTASWGIWNSWGGGRFFASKGNTVYSGNYSSNQGWGYNDGCVGMVTRMTLEPGDYIYSMQNRVWRYMSTGKGCTDKDLAVRAVKGILYVRPYAEGDDAEFSHTNADADKAVAIAYKEMDMSVVDFEMQTVAFHITEAGTYEFGVKAYLQDFVNTTKGGGALEAFDARIFAKTDAAYSKAQLEYEADVREQISVARNNLTTAAANLADPAKPWGHAELQAAIDEIEPIVAAFEAWTQDAVIATMTEIYDSSKGLEAINEEYDEYYRGMASEVYRTATKLIIAANREFDNKNNKLA